MSSIRPNDGFQLKWLLVWPLYLAACFGSLLFAGVPRESWWDKLYRRLDATG